MSFGNSLTTSNCIHSDCIQCTHYGTKHWNTVLLYVSWYGKKTLFKVVCRQLWKVEKDMSGSSQRPYGYLKGQWVKIFYTTTLTHGKLFY